MLIDIAPTLTTFESMDQDFVSSLLILVSFPVFFLLIER